MKQPTAHLVSTGTSGSAASNIKTLLDVQARNIAASHTFRTLLDPDVPAQKTLANYAFQFEGIPAHHATMFKRIYQELQGSLFFESLHNKHSLAYASVARFLLHHVPFSRLIALATSSNIVSVASLLLHALGATNHSFLIPATCHQRRVSEVGAFARAAADHLLRIQPLACAHSFHLTAHLNQSRRIEVIAAASADRLAPPGEISADSPVHISLDCRGHMFICGTNKRSIRVLDAQGNYLRDVSIKTADGSALPVEFLRASTIDWTTGNIYVTDRDADAVHCITPDGRLLASMKAGICKKPRSLSWCAVSRRVAVADYDNHQVIILDCDLNVLVTLKGPAPGDSFQNPIDTEFDANGFLYILDSRNNRQPSTFPATFVRVFLNLFFSKQGCGDER
jgi:hypothetical protein